MKTYPEFLEYVKENIVDFMPPEYSGAVVDILKVTKDNNMVLDGMTIRKDERSSSPMVYLEQYYTKDIINHTNDISVCLRSSFETNRYTPFPNTRQNSSSNKQMLLRHRLVHHK